MAGGTRPCKMIVRGTRKAGLQGRKISQGDHSIKNQISINFFSFEKDRDGFSNRRKSSIGII